MQKGWSYGVDMMRTFWPDSYNKKEKSSRELDPHQAHCSPDVWVTHQHSFNNYNANYFFYSEWRGDSHASSFQFGNVSSPWLRGLFEAVSK